MTSKRPKLILLEMDPQTVDRFRRGAGRYYDVRVETALDDALALLKADATVAAFVAGTNRTGEAGISVLERVKMTRGDVLRIMLAAPSDLGTVIQGVHSGVVERSLNLPVSDSEILSAVTRPTNSPPARGPARRAS